MITPLALLAFTTTVRQVSSPPGLTFEGKPVPFVLPASRDTEPNSDVRSWSGWGTLAGTPRPLFATAGDWSSLKDAPGTILWREKVVLFTQIDRIVTLPDGTIRLRRHSMDDNQLLDATLSVRRVQAWISRVTEGKVQLVCDLSIEREGIEASGTDDLYSRYLAPRVNGGSFEAEDKLFRGPYQGIVAITPESFPRIAEEVNGMPLSGVSYFQEGGLTTPGGLDQSIFSRWAEQVLARSQRSGLGRAWPTSDEWKDVATVADLSLDGLETNLRKARKTEPGLPDPFDGLMTSSFKSANYSLTVAADTERNHALLVQEAPGYRGGGVVLGLDLSKVDIRPDSSLSFFAKSDAKDPMAVGFRNGGKSYRVCLGRDLEPADPTNESEVAFKYDGTWQRVRINLNAIKSRLGAIDAVLIEPPIGSTVASRLKPPAIEIRLDEFSVESANSDFLPPLSASPTSMNPLERSLAAASPSATSADLIKFLADPDRDVKATALRAFQTRKDPLAEPAITELSMSIDPQLAELAVLALAGQGTESSNTALRNALKNGITDRARATAALVLAETKDPKLAGDIMILLANRSWQTREASVRALGKLPGLEAGIIRLSYLQQTDPAIKLAATQSSDPSREYDMRKIQWSAVNEPSDMVRLQSLIKLVQSPEATFKADGYKGVRDDSIWLRMKLFQWMQDNPSEEHRKAVFLGLADSHPSVRAAAVGAWAYLPGSPTITDLATILNDRYPTVQIAVLRAARERKLVLPAPTIELYKSSPDPAVGAELSKYLLP